MFATHGYPISWEVLGQEWLGPGEGELCCSSWVKLYGEMNAPGLGASCENSCLAEYECAVVNDM